MENGKKIGIPLKELAPYCRQAAAQGAVLLKNENEMLPIKDEDRIALFGRCQIDYYRSGTGSGGAVNVEYSTNLLDGLRRYDTVHINEELVSTYQNWIKSHPFDNGNGTWASEPWHQEEMPLNANMVQDIASVCNKAIVVIGRTAGEDKDNEDRPGSYRLTEDEYQMLSTVTKHFTQVAVILNVSNIIDMSWLHTEMGKHIKAVLYTWHGGIEGGNAAADIIAGEVSPSGHLTDTIAYSIEDYPAYPNYGNEDVNYYVEDIYVGYRYFETFCPEKVMFPFGYGLSYTTFTTKVLNGNVYGEDADKVISIQVKVTNTGSYTGKEVVQVYAQLPQGNLGQPAKVLVNFEKTSLLAPGESQILTIDTSFRGLASYDDSGITGNAYCYVLEAGDYHFYVGSDCRNNVEITKSGKALISLKQTLIVKKLQQAAAPTRAFQRIKPGSFDGKTYEIQYEQVPLRKYDLKERILSNLPKQLTTDVQESVSFRDVWEGNASLEDFTAKLSVRELAAIVRGEGMCNARVTPGTAAAFGGVSDELIERGIPTGCAADGPSGIRMDTGGKATQLPIGTLLACSFDPPMVEKLFELEGRELVQNEIDTLLGPGINIHRHPLNGRNFEYFSEDPLVTGIFATACEKGMAKVGVTGTLKHFACNNQEKARHSVDAVVSERALREIYLRAFEMGVKEGGARAIMTTYNPMNGYQNSCNYDLNTTILRKEWGYTGIVMTDWWAKLDNVIEGGHPNYTDTASMVRSQNDIYMVVNNFGAAINAKNDNTEQALLDGTLTIGELQQCAMNILRFLLDSPAGSRPVKVRKPVDILPCMPLQTTEKPVSVSDKIDISNGRAEHEDIYFEIEKEGLYGIEVDLMSAESDRAQMLSQVYINGQKAADIQTNGTWEKWVTQRAAKVHLHQGVYCFTIKHVRPGIQLSAIQFVEE